jgi:hypothetical protein
MKYFLKRRVFEGGTVYITGDPVVIENWGTLEKSNQMSNDQERMGKGVKVDIPILRGTCNLLRT